MHITRRALIAIGLASVTTPVLGQSTTPRYESTGSDLYGDYQVEGRNADGSAYKGALTIGPEADGISVHWTIGSDTYSGSGVLSGRILTVDWGDTHPVIYVLMPDGALHGTWGNGLALERATPRS